MNLIVFRFKNVLNIDRIIYWLKKVLRLFSVKIIFSFFFDLRVFFWKLKCKLLIFSMNNSRFPLKCIFIKLRKIYSKHKTYRIHKLEIDMQNVLINTFFIQQIHIQFHFSYIKTTYIHIERLRIRYPPLSEFPRLPRLLWNGYATVHDPQNISPVSYYNRSTKLQVRTIKNPHQHTLDLIRIVKSNSACCFSFKREIYVYDLARLRLFAWRELHVNYTKFRLSDSSYNICERSHINC